MGAPCAGSEWQRRTTASYKISDTRGVAGRSHGVAPPRIHQPPERNAHQHRHLPCDSNATQQGLRGVVGPVATACLRRRQHGNDHRGDPPRPRNAPKMDPPSHQNTPISRQPKALPQFCTIASLPHAVTQVVHDLAYPPPLAYGGGIISRALARQLGCGKPPRPPPPTRNK